MNYEIFMEEYFDEARLEQKKYEDSVNYISEAEKPGVFKHNFYLRDNLQFKYVTPVLATQKARDTIMEFVGKFLDDHHTQLSTSGPVYIFTFGEKEVSVLYELFNITKEKLLELYNNMINETYYGNISKFITGWVVNAPHKLLITAILSDAFQKGYDDIVECCEYMWAFSEYAICYRNFWKIGVKEDVMKSTIEHLGRNIVTKVNGLQGLLKYDGHAAIHFYKTAFVEGGPDDTYIELMRRMRSQIMNKFRKIANAYYDNDKENATQHTKDSHFDDGTIAEVEGIMTNVAQTVDKIVSKFISSGVNVSIAEVMANGNNVDKDTLIGYINQIMSSKNNNIPKFIEDVVISYFNKNPTNTSIIPGEFINYGLALYRSISTSKDELYMEIRLILDNWTDNIIGIPSLYKSPGTIINYKRAIFNYMILMINHYN